VDFGGNDEYSVPVELIPCIACCGNTFYQGQVVLLQCFMQCVELQVNLCVC
jgi:hypothetical protein